MNQTAANPASDHQANSSDEEIGFVAVKATAQNLAALALRGMVFTALTFGLYRFWYVTKIRQYFWAHTRLGNYPFEFTGRPVDLIVGFFMAVAILLPLYLGLFVVSLGLQDGVLVANMGAIVLLWFLSQFGLYRSRNYRLTRTLWRGLRFRQGGSGVFYAGLSMLWFAAGVASVGWLWPLRRRALQAYRLRHTYFGNQRASFDAAISPLYCAGWPLFLGISIIAVWVLWRMSDIWQAVPQNSGFMEILATDFRNVPFSEVIAAIPFAEILWTIGTACLAVMLVLAFAGPSYLAAEARHFANATSFGSIRLKSTLTRQALLAVWGKFLLTLAAFSAVYLGLGAVLFGAFLSSDLPVGVLDSAMTRFWFFVVLFLYYCIGFIAYAVIHLVCLRFQIWQVIGNSLSISPTSRLSAIEASRSDTLRRRDAFGDGIADALDAGGV